MVQFGKRLQIEKHSEWSAKYIDYDGLKKAVKPCANAEAAAPKDMTVACSIDSDNGVAGGNAFVETTVTGSSNVEAEQKFFKLLDSDVAKVGGFYIAKFEEFQSKLAHIKQQVSYLQAKSGEKRGSTSTQRRGSAFFKQQNSAGEISITENADSSAEQLIEEAASGDTDAVGKLVNEQNVDVNSTDYDLRGAAHLAAAHGHLNVLKLLQQLGCDLDKEDRYANTPLREAVLNGHSEVVEWMRTIGIVLDFSTHEEELFDAVSRGEVTRVQALLNGGVDVNVADYDKRTPLHIALACSHKDVAQLLLSKGASKSNIDRWGQAAGDAGEEHASQNLATNAAPAGRNTVPAATAPLPKLDTGAAAANAAPKAAKEQGAALRTAASSGTPSEIKTLLRAGASPMAADYDGRTALHLAAARGHPAIVRLLVSATNVNINCLDRWGRTPFEDALHAEAAGAAKAAKMLQAKGGVVINRFTGYALCKAAATADLARLVALQESGVSLNTADYDGRTALHLAASNGHTDIVRWLIRQGVQLNARDRFNHMPLDDAVREDKDEAIHVLMDAESAAQPAALQKVGSKKRLKGLRPLFQANSVEGINVAKARQQLKYGLMELHRGINMLHSFGVINSTGFTKILKKHDKISKWNAKDSYLQAIKPVRFNTFDELNTMKSDMMRVYASVFTHGNQKKALEQLAGRQQQEASKELPFSSGCMLGLSFVLGIMCIERASSLGRVDNADDDLVTNAWPVYRCLIWLLLHTVGFGLNLFVFECSQINYRFIFMFDPSDGQILRPQHLVKVGSAMLLMVLVAFFATLAHADPQTTCSTRPWTWDQLASIPPAISLGISVAVTMFVLFNPFDVLQLQARYRFCKVVLRNASAPFLAVRFEDFFLGDQITSHSRTLVDIVYIFVFYFSGARESGAPLSAFPKAVKVICSFLPLWWRFAQCFRRYADQGQVTGRVRWFFWYVDKRWHHLHNAGKYGSSILALIMSAANDHATSGPLFYVWLCCAIWSTAYSFFWDMWYDWGLWRNTTVGKKNWLLREKLQYPQPVYYVCMVADLVLRLTWALSMCPFDDELSKPVHTFVYGTLEISRRIMWNCFRVENEQLHNVGQYRAIVEVPLPFNQGEFQERVDQVRLLKQQAQHKKAKAKAKAGSGPSVHPAAGQ